MGPKTLEDIIKEIDTDEEDPVYVDEHEETELIEDDDDALGEDIDDPDDDEEWSKRWYPD